MTNGGVCINFAVVNQLNKFAMEQIKTIKTNNVAEFGECLKAHAAINKDVHIILMLETGQQIRGYYFSCGGVVTLHYLTRDGERKCNYVNLTPAAAVDVVEKWCFKALRLHEPYLMVPNSVYYDEKDLGRFSVHARDTKHGLKYDVVRMIGVKRVQPLSARWLPRRVFRFQRYYTTDYRGACALAEYLNAKQNKRPRLSCCEVVKKYWGGKITLCWVNGSCINNENFNEKFNVLIFRPEIKSIFVENEFCK